MRYQGTFKTNNEDTIRVTIDTDCVSRMAEVRNYKHLKFNQIEYQYSDREGTIEYVRGAVNNRCYILDSHKVSGETYGTDTYTDASGNTYTSVPLIRTDEQSCHGIATFGGRIDLIKGNLFLNTSEFGVVSVWLPDTCTTIIDGAFSGATYLTEVYGRNIEYIGDNVFSGCTKLVHIDLYNAKYIGNFAFNNCSAMVFEELKLTGTEFGTDSFRNCTKLRQIYLKDMRAVGTSVFAGCDGLKKVTFDNVYQLNPYAFARSMTLKEITIYGLPPYIISPDVFDGITGNGTIYLDMEDDYSRWVQTLPNFVIKSNTIPLTFSGEEPVVIKMSSDGLFAPIKSRSCTIKLVTETPYFDMYSPKADGTRVLIERLEDSETLFKGYLTPCRYNQPYVNLDELELECVDSVSVLKNIKYDYMYSSPAIISVAILLRYILNEVGGYADKIYVAAHLPNITKLPMLYEYVNDENFFEDDDEHKAKTCYDVISQIMQFYGATLTIDGNNIWIIDNKITATAHTVEYFDLNDKSIAYYDNYVVFSGNIETIDVTKNIDKGTYLGVSQNVEIDSVYNKVSVKDNIYDIDTIVESPLDDERKMNYIVYSGDDVYTYRKSSKSNYFIYSKAFTYDDTEKWSNKFYKYSDTILVVSGNVECSTYKFPVDYTGVNTDITAICALPIKTFSYDRNTTIPHKPEWKSYIAFYTQPYQWYLKKGSAGYSYSNIIDKYGSLERYWDSKLQFEFIAPTLVYENKEELNYSPGDPFKTNYICFNGSVEYDGDHTSYRTWFNDGTAQYSEFPYTEIDGNGDVNLLTRSPSNEGYNQGWPYLRFKLQIGDKYWNGTSWVSGETDFIINVHKEEVISADERFVLYNWNKMITNHSIDNKIGKECYAIPIKNADCICGKMKLTVYTPFIPWDDQLKRSGLTDKVTVEYKKIPPVIYLKDFKVDFECVDDKVKWVELDEGEKNNDDVIYSNEIDTLNIEEFDEYELMINSLNKKYETDKPLARSYMLIPFIHINGGSQYLSFGKFQYLVDGVIFGSSFYGRYKRPEAILVEKFYDHYSTPKKIYNCEIRGWCKPYSKVTVSAIPDTAFIVDEQDFDVKTNQNTIKIIEY